MQVGVIIKFCHVVVGFVCIFEFFMIFLHLYFLGDVLPSVFVFLILFRMLFVVVIIFLVLF
jgi:hypothetical protein